MSGSFPHSNLRPLIQALGLRHPVADSGTGSDVPGAVGVVAHSNIEMVAGWGLRLRPLGITGSSTINSAQKNSNCCGSAASS